MARPLRIEFPGAVYLQHGYTLVEIGREAGLHCATVSRIIKAMEEKDVTLYFCLRTPCRAI